MGSDPIALPFLDRWIEHFHQEGVLLDAVFTQPDRPTGRGKILTPNAIKTWAQEKGIPVYQPERLDAQGEDQFRRSDWDLAVVMAYGHLIRKSMLEIPRFGFYNLHASLLPKLRGASPIETAIATGESETGVSLMRMAPGLDDGPVLGMESCPIKSDTTSAELRNDIAQLCFPLLKAHVHHMLSDHPPLVEQDHSQATYCRKLDKTDGWLDFSLTTREILDHIRAFQEWPGAFFEYEGARFRIGSASATHRPESYATEGEPGLLIQEEKQLRILTADSAVMIETIQKPGGKLLACREFLNGFQFRSPCPLKFPRRFDLVSNRFFKKPLSTSI